MVGSRACFLNEKNTGFLTLFAQKLAVGTDIYITTFQSIKKGFEANDEYF